MINYCTEHMRIIYIEQRNVDTQWFQVVLCVSLCLEEHELYKLSHIVLNLGSFLHCTLCIQCHLLCKYVCVYKTNVFHTLVCMWCVPVWACPARAGLFLTHLSDCLTAAEDPGVRWTASRSAWLLASQSLFHSRDNLQDKDNLNKTTKQQPKDIKV